MKHKIDPKAYSNLDDKDAIYFVRGRKGKRPIKPIKDSVKEKNDMKR